MMLCKCSWLPEIMSEKIQVNDKQELRKSIAETGTTAAAVAVPAATSSVIGETSEASAAGPAGGSTREKPAFVLPPLQAPSPGEGEACVVPGAPDCGSGTGAGGCPAAATHATPPREPPGPAPRDRRRRRPRREFIAHRDAGALSALRTAYGTGPSFG